MLQKIQKVWNSILRQKKLSNTINIYSLKNNLKASNAVSNSIVFFINSVKSIKLKSLVFSSKKGAILNFNLFCIIVFFFILAGAILYII